MQCSSSPWPIVVTPADEVVFLVEGVAVLAYAEEAILHRPVVPTFDSLTCGDSLSQLLSDEGDVDEALEW